MLRRGALLGLVLLVPSACNFRIEPGWTPPGARDAGDGGPGDAGLDGQALVEWCANRCTAGEDEENCSRVICADAAVCVDDPPCDRCVVCRDE